MKKPMPPTEIKRALAKAGYSQSEIAAGCEVSKSLVSRVIKGTATSFRVQIYIAEKIGRPANEVWPINKNPSKPGPKPFGKIR